MKTGQYFALIALLMLGSAADAQWIKGGAGFVKLGIANAPGAGTVLDQIAPVGISFICLVAKATTEPAISCWH